MFVFIQVIFINLATAPVLSEMDFYLLQESFTST